MSGNKGGSMKQIINKNLSMAVASAMLLMSQGVSAETDLFGGKVKAGGYMAQHWQTAIEVDGPAALAGDVNADSGFARLRFGLWFAGQVTDNVSFFVELAEEPNDQGDGNYQITQDLAWIDFKLSDSVILRLGNVFATTMNFIRYSDGGSVQGNPMIGNGINDMITAEEGVWLLGNHKTNMGTWDWNLTVAKPSFFGDASEDSGYNYSGRTSLVMDNGFGIGAGYFKTTGDAQCTGSSCTLSDGGAFGSLIGLGDGDNYDFGSKTLNARYTQPGIIPGISADIWQIDLMYSTKSLGFPFLIHGFYGQGEDDYAWANGSYVTSGSSFTNTGAEQSFWGILARIDFTENMYLATRYGVSKNDSPNLPAGDNEANRIQVSAGYWMNDSTLFKAEYVRQEEGSVSGGGRCQFAAGDCEWDGFVLEASISF